MELLDTDTLFEAKQKFKEKINLVHLKTQSLSLEKACGKTIATKINCQTSIPPFCRSTMDGYAIRAQDSFGASSSNPLFFDVVDVVDIDEVATVELQTQQAIQVQTGSMIPKYATAVVMKEYCEVYSQHKMIVYHPVSHGENINQKGEDMKQGECLIPQGKILTAADIGILASQGISEVEVFSPLTLSIISTGDELVDLDEPIQGAHIHDMNSYALQACALENDFEVVERKLICDDEQKLYTTCQQAMEVSDIVILSGGSSKGKKDFTRQVFEKLNGEILTHGIAIKPGKPTIIGFNHDYKTLLIGLPGNPLAALLMFQLIVVDGLKEIKGTPSRLKVFAQIQENVSNNQGRETCLFVKLEKYEQGYFATPIYTKSANISCFLKADGITRIAATQEGLKKGSWIEVEVLS